jgi:hypothetical protein
MGKKHVYTYLNDKGESYHAQGFEISDYDLKTAMRTLKTESHVVAVLRDGEMIARRLGNWFHSKDPENPVRILLKGQKDPFGHAGYEF